MNPWYEILVHNCYEEHDKYCQYGYECSTRKDHVMHHYVPSALKDRVERLQFENKELRQANELPHALR